MAGPWERFQQQAVEQEAAPPISGPWDRFRDPNVSTTPDGRTRIRVTPEAEPVPPQQQPLPQPQNGGWETALDVGRSAVTGVGKGLMGLAGAGGDVRELIGAGVEYATGSPEARQNATNMLRSVPLLGGPASGQIRREVEQNVTGPLYAPQTGPGKYAGTIGEFVPGAVLAPGSVIGNTLKFAVLPGAASERAGQATEGTSLEPFARGGAAIATGGAAALLSRPATAQQALAKQLPRDLPESTITQAKNLIRDAQARGVNLTWPEVLEAVAPGTGLTNMQRTLEASADSRQHMAQFMAPRPQQIDRAARAEFDSIAPRSANPMALPREIQETAAGIVGSVEGAINRHTRPFYQAAEQQRLDPQTFARVSQDPVFQEGLRRLRADPWVGPAYAQLPDDSVAVADVIKKMLDETGRNLRDPVAGTARNNFAASLVDQGNRRLVDAADAATGSQAATASQPAMAGSYETARQIQQEARRRYLTPLLDGPIGKLAERDLSIAEALRAVFPKGAEAVPGMEQQVGQAVGLIANRSPRLARDLVRTHAEVTFNEAAAHTQRGANQMGGANFVRDLVGNPQQRANMEAAVRALPNGEETWRNFNAFLEVAAATGKREPVGSRTAFNAGDLRDLSTSGPVGTAAKLATSPNKWARGLGEAWERWQLGNNLDELARIITDPNAGNMLRALARHPVGSREAQVIAGRMVSMVQTTRTRETQK